MILLREWYAYRLTVKRGTPDGGRAVLFAKNCPTIRSIFKLVPNSLAKKLRSNYPMQATSRAFRITSSAPAAIAVLVVEGPEAWNWLKSHWRPNMGTLDRELEVNRIRYGTIYTRTHHSRSCGSESSPTTDESSAGESIVLCRTAPERFELHCHGGPTASTAILDSLEKSGFSMERPDREIALFETDPISSAATSMLLQARSLATSQILIDQARGALKREYESIGHAIQSQRDDEAEARMQTLLEWEPLGLHLIDPWQVVLAGPPNAGKSSLLNKLLGYERTIVHESAGTTRDLIPEATSLGGWPVVLIDSAGVRETSDAIEQRGVSSSFDAIAKADAILLLVPHDTGWSDEHDRIMAHAFNKRLLVVHTKCDLGQSKAILPELSHRSVEVSIHDTTSIARLMKAIENILVPAVPKRGAPVPFLPEQFNKLRTCLRSLHSGLRSQALEAIVI